MVEELWTSDPSILQNLDPTHDIQCIQFLPIESTSSSFKYKACDTPMQWCIVEF